MTEDPKPDPVEQTLELLAAAADDITPLVYERFFALRPEAQALWDDDTQMNQGHMLNEIFVCLMDQAASKSYLDEVYEVHVADHIGMGVVDASMYADFLHALQLAVADVLGENWPRNAKAAFQHQCDQMRDRLLEAEQVMIDRGLIGLPGLKLRNFSGK